MEEKRTIKDLLTYFSIIAKELGELTSIVKTLDTVMFHIGNIFGPENSAILLKKRDGSLKFVSVSGDAEVKLKDHCINSGEGIAGWIADNGRDLIIDDVYKDKRFSPVIDKVTGFRTKSIIGVPLMTSNRTFGVVELVNRLDKKLFTDIDLMVLRTIADLTALALERLYYYHAMMRYYATDPTTGVYTRKAFLQQYEVMKNRCLDMDSKLSIFVVTLRSDSGKREAVTAKELKAISEILKRCKIPKCTIYRYSSRMFVMMIYDAIDEDIDKLSQKIKTWFSREVNSSGKDIGIETWHSVICSETMKDIRDLMDIDKELKNIESEILETESNFSETIDSIISQENDGINLPGVFYSTK